MRVSLSLILFPCGMGFLIFKITSTWPAVWEVGPNWPNGGMVILFCLSPLVLIAFFGILGEVDILEGVNDVSPNQATLHTSPGTSHPSSVLPAFNQSNVL